MGSLSRLRTLNISFNEITHLPLELTNLVIMDTFVLDHNPLVSPHMESMSPETLDGTKAVQALCAAAGKTYVPPSQYLLGAVASGGAGETKDDVLLTARRLQEEQIRALLEQKEARDLSRQEEAEVARRAQAEQERQLQQMLQIKSAQKQEFVQALASQSQREEEHFRVLDEERRLALMDFASQLRRADSEENAKAQALLEEYERIRNDPSKLQVLMQESDALDKAILHRAVVLQASRDAAIEAARVEEVQNNALAASSTLQKEETRALALQQLAVYQAAIDHQMQSFLNELDSLR